MLISSHNSEEERKIVGKIREGVSVERTKASSGIRFLSLILLHIAVPLPLYLALRKGLPASCFVHFTWEHPTCSFLSSYSCACELRWKSRRQRGI